jgi:hypothetical protein
MQPAECIVIRACTVLGSFFMTRRRSPMYLRIIEIRVGNLTARGNVCWTNIEVEQFPWTDLHQDVARDRHLAQLHQNILAWCTTSRLKIWRVRIETWQCTCCVTFSSFCVCLFAAPPGCDHFMDRCKGPWPTTTTLFSTWEYADDAQIPLAKIHGITMHVFSVRQFVWIRVCVTIGTPSWKDVTHNSGDWYIWWSSSFH